MGPLTTTEEKIQRYYDNLWAEEKKFTQKFLDGGFHFGYYERGVTNYTAAILNMNKYVGEMLDISDGKAYDVLEAGCGIGATTRYLAKRFPNCHFTGISLGREEIDLAKKLQNHDGLSNATFFSGNYKSTGFQESSFDRVFALESVVYAVKKEEVVNEFSRILRPKGKCIIIDGFFPRAQPSSSFLKNAYALMSTKRSLPGILSLQEMQSYLKSAGFTDITVHNLSKNISRHYFFGGFFVSLRGLVSAEVLGRRYKAKGKTVEDSDKIVRGAGFLEMLMGITKNLGYYAIIATKK
jgi:ubiquinone/menaquinone biosynthesis C-methylase UbiE